MEEDRYRECMILLERFGSKYKHESSAYYDNMMFRREFGKLKKEEEDIVDCVDFTRKYWNKERNKVGICKYENVLNTYDRHKNFRKVLSGIDADNRQKCYDWGYVCEENPWYKKISWMEDIRAKFYKK